MFSLPTPTVYRPASGGTTYTLDDLIPVARVTADPFYLAVSAENEQFQDAESVLTYIQENPGEFTSANAGNGGIAHVAFASFLAGEGLGGFLDSTRTLAVHMYVLSSEGLHVNETFATAVVLLVLVVLMNMVTTLAAKKMNKGVQHD